MEPGYYSYVMSNATKDILKKMALEDHVSFATELEMAVSCWYRFRHGYTDLATLNPCMIVHEDGRGEIKFIKEGRNG